MPEKNKCETEKKKESQETEVEMGDWSKDGKNRDYYYDDAHGYEVYTDDDDKETEES